MLRVELGYGTPCKLCEQGGNYQNQIRVHRNWVIAELAKNGMPVWGISRLFELDQSTVYEVLRDYGISATELRKERKRSAAFLAAHA